MAVFQVEPGLEKPERMKQTMTTNTNATSAPVSAVTSRPPGRAASPISRWLVSSWRLK